MWATLQDMETALVHVLQIDAVQRLPTNIWEIVVFWDSGSRRDWHRLLSAHGEVQNALLNSGADVTSPSWHREPFVVDPFCELFSGTDAHPPHWVPQRIPASHHCVWPRHWHTSDNHIGDSLGDFHQPHYHGASSVVLGSSPFVVARKFRAWQDWKHVTVIGAADCGCHLSWVDRLLDMAGQLLRIGGPSLRQSAGSCVRRCTNCNGPLVRADLCDTLMFCVPM